MRAAGDIDDALSWLSRQGPAVSDRLLGRVLSDAEGVLSARNSQKGRARRRAWVGPRIFVGAKVAMLALAIASLPSANAVSTGPVVTDRDVSVFEGTAMGQDEAATLLFSTIMLSRVPQLISAF